MNKRLLITALAVASLTLVHAQAPANVQAVDLGLSVKWASCNIGVTTPEGATTPEGYGDYFAWGGDRTQKRLLVGNLQVFQWG